MSVDKVAPTPILPLAIIGKISIFYHNENIDLKRRKGRWHFLLTKRGSRNQFKKNFVFSSYSCFRDALIIVFKADKFC
jgi:hypothetical protein